MRSNSAALALVAATFAACQGSGPYAPADTETECGTAATWTDSATGLSWQDGPPCDPVACGAAVGYCDELVADDFDDWRLPTIDELRTLVRGCPAVEPGGACGVTVACPGIECWDLVCYGCGLLDGAGAGGCYWDPGLHGVCAPYWSGPVWGSAGFDECWFISFDGSYLNHVGAGNDAYLRCVRGG